MWDNKQAASVAEVCLKKCGFVRNLQPILEAVEEQIFGQTTPINSDEFEVSDDYKNMQYTGPVLTSFRLLRDDSLSRTIDCKFQDDEFEWLKAIALDGDFTIQTTRRNGAVHDFSMVIDAPISPTNFSTDKVRLFVKLNGVGWNSSDFEISSKVQNTDERKLSKAYALYSMV